MNIVEALRVVLSPLGYLRARNSTKKYWDFIIPGLVAVATALLFVSPWLRITVFGEKGFVHGINELIQILVGFYIAALAAVASLANPTLDQGIAGEAIRFNNRDLTRRQFLCLAFSYLSLLTICIYGVGLAANLVAETIRAAISPAFFPFIRGTFGALYGFAIAQLGLITSVTLYYLGEKIHVSGLKANPTIVLPIEGAANQEQPSSADKENNSVPTAD